jgi:16S rRNA (cytosine967-C5)-methyltransferase
MTTPSRLRPAQFTCATEALTAILRLTKPADVVLQTLFRERPQMGSRDRALVNDLVYGVLRDLRRLQAVAGNEPSDLCAAWLIRSQALPVETLVALGCADAGVVQQRQRDFDESTLSEAQLLNLPDWLYHSLLEQHGAGETRALAAALNQPATVDLRVNTLKATRAEAQAALAAENISSEPTTLSPWGLRLAKRGPLQATRAFRDGLIEPQDEGSQLLALLLAPKPGETVVDFCAGAGGKTLALGALMQNRGALHALDTSSVRLERLAPRAKRAGLRIDHPHQLRNENDPWLRELEARCDAVLVDAPCSASGALRRNPELRLKTPDLATLQNQQLSILLAAARLVKPGGRLVYATCSLLLEENERVIERFFVGNPGFVAEDAGSVLRAAGLDYAGETLKLYPHRHGTDGFFAVALRRKA